MYILYYYVLLKLRFIIYVLLKLPRAVCTLRAAISSAIVNTSQDPSVASATSVESGGATTCSSGTSASPASSPANTDTTATTAQESGT